jgi:hypothetical protein
VSERIRGQNRVRGLLVCQGLPAPAGAKAWTALGLAGLGQLARPIAACGPDELWRGELQTLLDRLRFLDGQTRQVEARLDAIAARDPRVALLESPRASGQASTLRGSSPLDKTSRAGGTERFPGRHSLSGSRSSDRGGRPTP